MKYVKKNRCRAPLRPPMPPLHPRLQNPSATSSTSTNPISTARPSTANRRTSDHPYPMRQTTTFPLGPVPMPLTPPIAGNNKFSNFRSSPKFTHHTPLKIFKPSSKILEFNYEHICIISSSFVTFKYLTFSNHLSSKNNIFPMEPPKNNPPKPPCRYRRSRQL